MLAYSLIVLGQFTLVQQQQKSHIQCWVLNIHPLNIWKYRKAVKNLHCTFQEVRSGHLQFLQKAMCLMCSFTNKIITGTDSASLIIIKSCTIFGQTSCSCHCEHHYDPHCSSQYYSRAKFKFRKSPWENPFPHHDTEPFKDVNLWTVCLTVRSLVKSKGEAVVLTFEGIQTQVTCWLQKNPGSCCKKELMTANRSFLPESFKINEGERKQCIMNLVH